MLNNTSKKTIKIAIASIILGISILIISIIFGAKEYMENYNTIGEEEQIMTELAIRDNKIHPGEIQNLHISLKAANIAVKQGNEFAIETRNIDKDKVIFGIDKNTLIIKNKLHYHSFNEPKILITIPNEVYLDSFYLNIKAGNFVCENIKINSKNSTIKVEAGNIELNSLNSEKSEINCGIGNIKLHGNLYGETNIHTGIGKVEVIMNEKQSNFSYECKVGLGDIIFGTDKISGIGQERNNIKQENHINLDCGLGNISVLFY